MKDLKRILFFTCGTLSVAVGILGMFLPILPTTPFLLFAVFCYSRSSERFYQRLLNNRWCGDYIRNYREGRGMRRKHKTVALVLLWLAISYSALAATDALWIKIVLFGVAAGVTIHLLMMKSYTPDAEQETMPEQYDLTEETP
jgi:uncharacterized protein